MKKNSAIITAFLLYLVSTCQAAALSGSVKDPSGGVVANAEIILRGDAGQPRVTQTGANGQFLFPETGAGKYEIIVSRVGFQPYTQPIVITGADPAPVEIRLVIAELRQELDIKDKGATLANSDPNYRALRDSQLAEGFAVENIVLRRDLGVITLRKGSISFTAPVLGRVTAAVFAGEGEFTFTPQLGMEKASLRQITRKETITEPFGAAVFCFTDNSYQEIRRDIRAEAPGSKAKDIFKDFHARVRHRPAIQRSMIEALLTDEDMANIEADTLADLYNPKRPGFFSAYIYGRKHGDLRFHVKPSGVFPGLPSPEEVAIINVAVQTEEEGIWYLSHRMEEFEKGTASSHEDKRIIDAEHYKIETVLGKNTKLTATAEIRFKALTDGDRVLKFALLPNLRVTRVSVPGDRDIAYVQQKRDEDGSFYAILPAPMRKDQTYKLTVEYGGDKVVENAGGGNYYVGARTSWYPSLNGFTDRATFDLTFRYPKKLTLVSVGNLVREWTEENFSAAQWTSEIPLCVVGFNYGDFKKKHIDDERTKHSIDGFATSGLPDYLRGAESIGGMSPTRLTEQAMSQTQASLQIFNHWFGKSPYGRIAITQQPEFNFGQSWPTLVYLPLSAFLDSTQRWQLTGSINNKFTDFIQEVTPHEVAHQWWGHIVGWATYHDQWISEGFADFSAGLYLQQTEPKPEKFLKYWDRARETILEKNSYGYRANDAGPIWMGLRLNTFKNGGAYNRMIYPKGGYIVHMLRQMMYDPKTGDENFIKMMRDFVETHMHKNASTESFQAVVEKHMTPAMNLTKDGSMGWFFGQWVYGTSVPRYKFDYTVTPAEDGKFRLKGSLTQSEVTDRFGMLVPIYLDFDGKLVRLGNVTMIGNSTMDKIEVLLPRKPKRVAINAFHDVLEQK